jgi:hypothetical protein
MDEIPTFDKAFLDIIYHSEQIASRRCNPLTPDMTSFLAMQS